MLKGEPQTYKESLNSTNVIMWKEVIKSEIDSIIQNHTWELVDLPQGCKPLSSEWFFKKKRKVDGSIDKYKARVVIKGYKRTKDLDYFNTYSPMMRINFIRMVLAINALRNLKVHQKNVKIIFLNGDLDEKIIFLNECDKCVYVKDTEHGYVVACLYVDDMLIFSSDKKMIISTKNTLNSRFDMNDMGLVDDTLGIKIIRTSYGLMLSQSHYVDNILRKFDKDNSRISRTLVDVTLYLSKNKGESISQVKYFRVIGRLLNLMTCTRPGIAYAISKFSSYTRNLRMKN